MIKRAKSTRRFGVALAALGACIATACGRPVEVATFNIRMFPEPSTDMDAVADQVADLDASVIAVQEIRDRIAFEAMLERASVTTGKQLRLVAGPCGGDMLQITTGVVYDASVWNLLEGRGYPDLQRDGPCGPGLPGTLAVLEDDGKRLGVLSVHLHAFPRNYSKRKEQWGQVLTIVDEVAGEFDTDAVLAMGDYNTTGFRGEPEEERDFVADTVNEAGHALPTSKLACTEYWQPEPTGGDFTPSVLDHVVAHGGRWGAAEVVGMCRRMRCQAVDPDDLDPDFHRVSDHCPVVVRGRI